MKLFVDGKRRVWLSYEYLESVGICGDTVRNWFKRRSVITKHVNDLIFIEYESIPAPTRRKLYGKETLIQDARQEDENRIESMFFNDLNDAYNGKSVAIWRNKITKAYPGLKANHLNEFSRRASVIEKALTLSHGKLKELYGAYKRVYPDHLATKQRFCMMIAQARKEGILSAAVDKRIVREHTPLFGDEVKFLAGYILNHNKAFSLTMAYDMFAEACTAQGHKTPTYQWFRLFYHENKNTIDPNRYGRAEYEKYNQNYAKIIPALYAGDQWQMDGWRIPIYCKKYRDDGKTEYFVTYNLFAVIDAHSRKVIGYSISESENTQSILKGIEMAVKRTLTLPFEIVADNHSFNKTKEAGNIKEEMELLGVAWTIDSNPRRKAILERAFRTLGEKFFKKQYGYIGQGIRSKEKGGITQQELKDIYTKPDNFLTFDQVVAIASDVVLQYNSTTIKKLGDTPERLYEISEKPHAIAINQFQYLQLFTLKTEHKVSHGQITIRRGAHTYEYQLPAKYAHEYNNKTVTVRYADFDTIYLYDLQTNLPICNVDQKFGIHGAKANQTDQDKELLFKNKGRLQGIKTRARNQKQLWSDKAAIISPDAYEVVNRLTAPKDIIEKLRRDASLRAEVIEQGVNPDTIAELPKISEMIDPSMKPGAAKEDLHPFTTKEGSMRKVTTLNN